MSKLLVYSNSLIGSRFHFVVVQTFCAAVIAVPPAFWLHGLGSEAGDSIGTVFEIFDEECENVYAASCVCFSVFVRTMGTAPGGGKS
jgi:hypothetical protein